MQTPLVSIIVPIFNVEQHIGECIDSLLSQSYSSIEYIFVDDASPDNSMLILDNILADYPCRSSFVKVLRHETNKGLPAARNSGLAVAKGDYIFHCDSDDWIEPDMISDMMQVANNANADIVYTDFFLSFSKNERCMKQPAFKNPEDALRAMLDGSMKFNVWNKLIKRRLYADYAITFPDGRSMGEDMTILKLFCRAEKVTHLPRAHYHYMQTNPNAFTKRISEERLEQIRYNVTDVIHYIERVYGKIKFEKEIQYFKLNMKLSFLISTDPYMYNLWRKWYPEADAYIGENPAFCKRTRLIQYAALKKQDWLIKLYNYLIIKFVYGIVYR